MTSEDIPGGASAAPAEPPAERPPALERHSFEFHGNGAEFFRIWIVNLLLSIATLGIYSAWAKVRRLQYFYGHTTLAGSAFGYHGDPRKILKGRFIAAVLFAVYSASSRMAPTVHLVMVVVLSLAIPWLVVKSRQFTLRMSSWRGLRFDFSRDFRGAYRLYGWNGFLVLVTVGLWLPRFTRERWRFFITRSSYGATPFRSEARVWPFYRAVFGASGILLGSALLVGIVVVVLMAVAGIRLPHAEKTAMSLELGSFLVAYVLAAIPAGAYLQARNLNEVYGTTSLAGHRLTSSLAARRLAWLYFTNVLGVLFTLGLYAPWAHVRLTRYRLETLVLESTGSLDEFVAGEAVVAPGATGEEISEFFDVDFGL